MAEFFEICILEFLYVQNVILGFLQIFLMWVKRLGLCWLFWNRNFLIFFFHKYFLKKLLKIFFYFKIIFKSTLEFWNCKISKLTSWQFTNFVISKFQGRFKFVLSIKTPKKHRFRLIHFHATQSLSHHLCANVSGAITFFFQNYKHFQNF